MRPRILVVDDDPAVRMMVTEALRHEGYEVVSLADGAAGLETAAHQLFDLIVTNRFMPHMSGEELAARIKELYPGLPIPHVGVRSYDDVVAFPPDTYHLPNPFNLTVFRHTVRNILDHRAPQAWSG